MTEPKIDWTSIKAEYEAGMPLDAIASKHHRSVKTIKRRADNGGWFRPERPALPHDTMRRAYEHDGASFDDIASQFRCAASTVISLAASQGWKRGGEDSADEQRLPPSDPLGDRLAAMGFRRHVAPPSPHVQVRGPAWVR